MKQLKRTTFLIIISIIMVSSGCQSSVSIDTVGKSSSIESNMIIEVNEKDLIKVPEDQVLEYFNQKKNDFITLANYLLENESEFGTRPVIISKNQEIENIKDQRIKEIIELFIQQDMVKNITSLNDEIKDVYFLIDNEYGVFEQGIRYVSDRKIVDEDITKYNYVKRYEDLGNGWFYYLHHYNKIKDEDSFRKNAWNILSEEEKESVVNESNKAIVTLEDGKNI